MADSDQWHAGRTLRHMTEMNARIVNEFVAGKQVPEIAARYDLPEEYVDRVIEQTDLSKPEKRKWDHSWSNWGNRIAYSALAAIVISLLIGSAAIGWTLGVVLFVVTSAIASIRR